ncbi:MAG: hypothetical protein EAX87_08375 [Candidatus Thorarchaeota archaeon]|nr:hypothetical protein [Candidatus Thorarchaeota archaeon]
MKLEFDTLGVLLLIIGDLIMIAIVLPLVFSVRGLEYQPLAVRSIAPVLIFLVFMFLFRPTANKPQFVIINGVIFLILSIVSLVFAPQEAVLNGIVRIAYYIGAIVSTGGSIVLLYSRVIKRSTPTP